MSRSKYPPYRSAALVALAGLALAGCAAGDDAVFAPPSHSSAYTSVNPMVGSVVDVDVRRDPFSVPPAAFAQDVADAMRGWGMHGPSSFRPVANSTARYRIVFDFDGNGKGVCTGPAKAAPGASPVSPAPARVPAAAVLCRGDKVLSYVYGSVASDGGPESAEFRHSIGEMTAALLPAASQGAGHGGHAKS